jgi:hypothetical protein
MGTRNLTMIICDGKTKVAQYGQWDGYPEGQGKTVLKFLKKCDLNKFRERLNKVSFLTQKEIDHLWNECWAMEISKRSNSKTNELFKRKYPELCRDTAAKVLDLIYEGKATKLWNRSAFAKDSLWCEWVYVIDLDKVKLEIYTSYFRKPLTTKDRFYDVRYRKNKSHPVKILKSYSLKKLPTVKQFIKDLSFESRKDSEESVYNIIINHKFKQ